MSNQHKLSKEYTDLKMVWHQKKLKSFIDEKVLSPISVRVKFENSCCQDCFYCLAEGTMILTPNGSIPIEKLRKGDFVISGNRKPRKITRIFKRKSKIIYKIDVRYLPNIYASPEHPFLVENKFIETQNLKEGMKLKVVQPIFNLKSKGQPYQILYLSKLFNLKEKRYHSKRRVHMAKNKPPEEIGRFRLNASKYSAPQKMLLDYDFGRFCGLYLAEGNVNLYKDRPNSKSICFSFNKKEVEYIEFIKEFCNRYGFKYRVNKYDYLTTTQVGVYNSIFSIFIKKYFGYKGEYKRIPFELKPNIQFIKGLLKGFFEGDGCLSDYSMASTNKQLLYGIFQLLLGFGIIPTFYHDKREKRGIEYNIEGRKGKCKDLYSLRISRKQIDLFNSILNKDSLVKYSWRRKSSYVKIKKIELIKKSTKVFNLEVEEDNTYFAEFLLCHNCVYNSEYSGMHPTMNRNDGIPREKMIEILKNLNEMNVKSIILSGGGEPLMYPYIEEALSKILKYKIHLAMITNGQLLNGKKAELLGKADWVRVSLDYCNGQMFERIRRKPGVLFETIKENLKQFAKTKETSCDFGINCVVHKMNKDNIYDIAKFCKEIGVENIRFSPLWNPDLINYHKSSIKSVLEQIEKARKDLNDDKFKVYDSFSSVFESGGLPKRDYHRCYVMQTIPVIAADQNVYFCHNKAYDKSGLLGSIKNQSFKALWFSQETRKKFKEFDPSKSCYHQCSSEGRNLSIIAMLDSFEKANFP